MSGRSSRIYVFRNPHEIGPDPYRKLKLFIGILAGLYLLDLFLVGPQNVVSNLKFSLITIPVILVSLSFHEFAHAWMADFLGDRTPRHLGRLSLNPMAHLDLFGTLLLFFAGFGWAKPVPVNPSNFRVPDRAMMVVALAGPLSNILLALVGGMGLKLFFVASGAQSLRLLVQGTLPGYALYYTITINLALAFFNLFPLPPLDGSKVLNFFLSPRQKLRFRQIENLGPFLLIVLVSFGVVGTVITPMIQFGTELILGLFFR